MEAKIKTMPNYKKFEAKEVSTGRKVRCMKKEADSVFVYRKGARRYGYWYTVENFCRRYELILEKDETTAWRRRMKNVVKALSESGLWPEIRERFENMLAWGITWEEKREIASLYWDNHWKENIPAEAEEKITGYSKKYPGIVYKNEDGKWYFDTDYLFEMSACITKSMYFGKWNNRQEKDIIAQRLRDKQDYSCSHRVSYDVSFEYKADKNMAWYSEEYRDCGNGHYYLACNNSVALFCEDD